ncbi:MAG TPA: TonB-dependent receptor plug domain-containing protein, partial [Paracoccus sp.]|nr:TonB-dependent receptor plug domain-containing protein [Paracoccus sp. (in: a-proteobacteria)]
MANQPMTAGKSARRARLGRLNATVAAVLAAGLPAGAWAQNIILRNVESLGQLVVTAAGFEQAVADAPASISVITAEDLESGSYTNLADALSEVQGVAITGTGNERDIQIRGLPGAYTLVLVDGRRQSTRESRTNGSSGYEQSFLPPLEQIERIEVVRGPMSSLYGSDAMGGVVNVITRPVGDRWTGSVSAETTVQQHDDQGDGRQLSFSIGGPVIAERLGLQLWGRVYHRDEDTRTDAAGAVVDGLNGARNRDIGARLTFTPVAGHEFRLEGGSQRLRAISQHNTSSLWGGAVTRRDHDRDYVALGYSGTFGSTIADLSLQREEGSRTVYTGNPETPNVRVPRVTNTVLDGRLT